MSTSIGRTAAACVVAVIVAGAACVRDGTAQPAVTAQGRSVAIADDTASVTRLLRAVRGVDPLLCELATRNVDMHGSWSRWAPMNGDPLEVDSAASALIHWIQRDHNDPAVVPRLRAALADPDACVRRVAGSFLGRIDHPAALTALVGALDEPNADVRSVAALGLGLSSNQAAIAPLLRHLRDESAAVRRATAWSLGSLEASAALVPLVELLARDPDPKVRQAAAWALGEIDG